MFIIIISILPSFLEIFTIWKKYLNCLRLQFIISSARIRECLVIIMGREQAGAKCVHTTAQRKIPSVHLPFPHCDRICCPQTILTVNILSTDEIVCWVFYVDYGTKIRCKQESCFSGIYKAYSGLAITEKESWLQKAFKRQMNNVLGDEMLSNEIDPHLPLFVVKFLFPL